MQGKLFSHRYRSHFCPVFVCLRLTSTKTEIWTWPSGSNQTFLFLGDGTFRSGVPLNLSGYMSVGDFNEDGNIDLVTNAGGSSICFGKGDGTFSVPQSLSAGTPHNALAPTWMATVISTLYCPS